MKKDRFINLNKNIFELYNKETKLLIILASKRYTIFFILRFILVLVSILSIGFFIYTTCQNTLKHTLINQLEDSVEEGEFMLDSFFKTYLAMMTVIASADEIRKFNKNSPPQWFSESTQVLDILKRLNIIDIHGNGFSAEGRDYWIGDRNYFRTALSGQTVAEGPIKSRVDDSWIFVLAVPIFDKNKKVGAVLSASINIKSLNSILYSVKASEKGDTWLMNQDNILLAHTRSKQYPTGSYFINNWLADTKNPWINLKELPAVFESNNMIIAHKYLTQTQWTLWRSISLGDLLAPIRSVLIALGGLVFAIVLGISIFLVLRHKALMRLEEMKKEQEEARIKAYKKAYRLAYYDKLTRLPNRHSIIRYLKDRLQTNQTGELYLVSVAQFRHLNSIFGITFGDILLKEATLRLQKIWLQEEMFVFIGRLRDSDFLLFLETPHKKDSTSTVESLEQHSRDIIRAFETPIGQEVRVTVGVHIGACSLATAGKTPEDCLKAVEIALNEAQSKETSGFAIFKEHQMQLAQRRVELEQYFPQALARKEFELHYQAQFDLKKQCLIGYEALVRLNSPVFGMVPPGDFITLTEKTGFVLQLGMWAIKEAISFSLKINQDRKHPIVISVNVSPVQLLQPGFFEEVSRLILESECPTDQIGLEITESGLIETYKIIGPSIRTLMEKEIKISLDDFGTGYSSLNQLKNLPLNVLKIDKSFIDEIVDTDRNDLKSRKMIYSIIELAHQLDLKVVAEGVENEYQRDFLIHAHCDYIQGFLLARPLPADQIFLQIDKKL